MALKGAFRRDWASFNNEPRSHGLGARGPGSSYPGASSKPVSSEPHQREPASQPRGLSLRRMWSGHTSLTCPLRHHTWPRPRPPGGAASVALRLAGGSSAPRPWATSCLQRYFSFSVTCASSAVGVLSVLRGGNVSISEASRPASS